VSTNKIPVKRRFFCGYQGFPNLEHGNPVKSGVRDEKNFARFGTLMGWRCNKAIFQGDSAHAVGWGDNSALAIDLFAFIGLGAAQNLVE
jgi:hypothetical protein